MVKATKLVDGIVGSLRNYAKNPYDYEGYQKFCRCHTGDLNNTLKENRNAKEKKKKEEQTLGQI